LLIRDDTVESLEARERALERRLKLERMDQKAR
jgi:hypothetical protein